MGLGLRHRRFRVLANLVTIVTLLCFTTTSVAYAVPARSDSTSASPLGIDRNNYKEEMLSVPVLVAPAGETTTTRPVFSWGAVPGATRYEIDIRDKAGAFRFRRDGIKVPAFRLPDDMEFSFGSSYVFTVRAFDHPNHLASPYAEPMAFSVVRATTNVPPTAFIAAEPASGFAPLSVIFDGRASTDPDGRLVSWAWDFEADGTTDATGPTAAFTYGTPGSYTARLQVTDDKGATADATCAIQVAIPPPTAEISLVPTEITLGGWALLSWKSANTGVASIEPGIGLAAGEGTLAVSPLVDTTYTITVANTSGEASASAALKVVIPQPSASISVVPELMGRGEDARLAWSSEHADAVEITPDVGPVASSGELTITPSGSTTYTIVATNASGVTRASAHVRVLPVPSLPECSFGERYEDLIADDATISSFDANRFVLLSGQVAGEDGAALAGVIVSVHGASRYGTAGTDAQGRFFLPAEGGTLVLDYAKDGYLPASRKVSCTYRDVATAETVVMTEEDTRATTVTFDGDPSHVTVHRSTPISDAFGTRAATLVFSGANRAFVKNPDGTESAIDTLTVRATEFATEAALPGELPAASAYTYCVELSADEAASVRFESTVAVFVNNFMDLPVGAACPVGYFDRDRAIWVPSPDGVVVKVLDTNADGITDALDATGDGAADDLDRDGLTSDEAAGLSDPALYPPGAVFWRVGITHFSPYDVNWAFAPPTGASGPNGAGSSCGQGQGCPIPTGSYVTPRDQVLHEDVPIPGTDMTLHWASDRVAGYKRKITVWASGATVPASLDGIDVRLSIAGRTFRESLAAAPRQKVTFLWDGTDFRGRAVSGTTIARVSVGFIYEAVLQAAAGGGRGGSGLSAGAVYSFGQMGVPLELYNPDGSPRYTGGGPPARIHFVSWARSSLAIFRPPDESALAGGWTLSAVGEKSPTDANLLFAGDGRRIDGARSIIRTVAGSGARPSWWGITYGMDALSTPIGPIDVAAAPDGTFIIADGWANKVLRLDPATGRLHLVAGGTGSSGADGSPATATAVSPSAVAVGGDGTIYVAEGSVGRARKITPDGRIYTIAGDRRSPAYGGPWLDGALATQSPIAPGDVAVDDAGNVYLSQYNYPWVRMVTPAGRIYTVIGTGGDYGRTDDGTLARGAVVHPYAIAVGRDGCLYVTDAWQAKVKKIDVSGRLRTVAGGGSSTAEGVPATATALAPGALAFDAQGNLFIAEPIRNIVRKVDTRGIITTVAGMRGNRGFGGDGGAATRALLSTPEGITADAAGDLFVADSNLISNDGGNYRVRRVTGASGSCPFTTSGDSLLSEAGLTYVVDGGGRHKATLDAETETTITAIEYEAVGPAETSEEGTISSRRVVPTALRDRFEARTTVAYDFSGRPTSITSADGHVTRLSVDASGNLVRVTYPDGAHYDFTYDPGGLMKQKTDPKGAAFTYTFDEAGHTTKVTDPDGPDWSFETSSDDSGTLLSSLVTGEGNTTTYRDTSQGDAVTSTITGPAGAVTTYRSSADGLTAAKDLPASVALRFSFALDPKTQERYVSEASATMPSRLAMTVSETRSAQDTNADGKTDLICRTDRLNGRPYTTTRDLAAGTVTLGAPSGRTTRLSYDPASLLAREVSVPGILPQSFTYDTRGRVTSVTQGDRAASISYDASGSASSITAPDGATTRYRYDLMGRPTRIDRPDGTALTYRYDPAGNVTALLLPSETTHTFTYNASDSRKTWTGPLLGPTTYSYDKDRNLTGVALPSGASITAGYTHGFLTQIATPESTTTLSRGRCGRLNAAARDGQSVAYTYDGTLITNDARSGLVSETVSYAYNPDFNVSAIRYVGATETITYDPDALITRSGPFTISRDEANGLPLAVSSAEASVTRTFSEYGELSSSAYRSAGSDAFSWQVARDVSGRIISKTETGSSGAHTYAYAYDAMGRLTCATRDGSPFEAYTYDAQGNRTAETSTARGIARTLTYDQEDRIISAGEDTYTFDADGFLCTKRSDEGTTTYSYSRRGELLSATLASGPALSYRYDPMGRRIARYEGGTLTEKYLWKDATTLLAVLAPDGSVTYRFSYADDRVPYAVETSAGTLSLAFDQVGSLRTVTDATGAVVKEVTYDNFGSVVSDTNPTLEIPLGFAGGLADPATGLVRFGARDYDPQTGRWTAKDPIDFTGGDANLYGYCVGDPVDWVDSDGLFAEAAAACGLAGGAALAPLAVGAAAAVAGVGIGYYLYRWLREAAGDDPCPYNPGWNPTKQPGPGFEWRGRGPTGSSRGSWHNPDTDESLHPDLDNAKDGPHWDYYPPGSKDKVRVPPTGVQPGTSCHD